MSSAATPSMDLRTATRAFLTLFDPPHRREPQLSDDVHALVTTLLEACGTREFVARAGDLLIVALTLLKQPQPQPRSQEDTERMLLLLRLVFALKYHMTWAASTGREVTKLLVGLFMRETCGDAAPIVILPQMIHHLVNREATLHVAVGAALAEWSRTVRPSEFEALAYKRLCRWDSSENLQEIVQILLYHSEPEQELALKCLLLLRWSVHRAFVSEHRGTELMLQILEKSGSLRAKKLAFVFVQDMLNVTNVSRMHIWSQRRKVQQLAEYETVAEAETEVQVVSVDDVLWEVLQFAKDAAQMDQLDVPGWRSPIGTHDCPCKASPKMASAIPTTSNTSIRTLQVQDDGDDDASQIEAGAEAENEDMSYADEGETLPNGLQVSELSTKVEQLVMLGNDDALVLHHCVHYNLLEVVASSLRGREVANTDLRVRQWMLLLKALHFDPPLSVTPTVVVGLNAVIEMIRVTLTMDDNEDASWSTQALRSPLLRTEEMRAVIVDKGMIPLLVRRLAEQNVDRPLGWSIIACLRDFAACASSLHCAHEINQVMASWCTNAAIRSADEREVHFQNLLLVYRDIPGVRLGRSAGVDKVISVAAVAELLHTRGSDVEKLLMIHFLHTELGLHVLDPVRCVIDVEMNAVVKAVVESLDDVIATAVRGPADARKPARRILTLVARNDAGIRERLREVQMTMHPSMPALVVAEVLGDGSMEDDEMYVYSDGEDDDAAATAANEDINADAFSSDCEGDQECEDEYCIEPATPVNEREVRGALEDLSLSNDWELL